MTQARIFSMGTAIATVLSASSLATAADAYFDSVGGSDTADGKTEATAKQTLKMPTGTGNTVYLKRGSSWTMTLNANNVTVKTYGTGDRPAIIGTITVTSSTVEGLAAKPPAGGTKAVNAINVMSDSTFRRRVIM